MEIKRTFAALPRYIDYRCGHCGKVIASQDKPKICPHCSADFKEVSLTPVMDEIPKRRI